MSQQITLVSKRPTRQWAAWTRQEEESFFTALRQVGKNFEKITHRVQSKNKDQVRHYYYRLVRRMNKLLGPGLCLDAKDSKDTNAAMLRWWSLLEKYSCKASKLRLKPRRFKIFIEALEHQLLKDRRKNVKKRPSQGENCPLAAPNNIPNQSRASGQDACMVKLVLVDGQNIQKLGSGKTSLKRNINVGVSRTNNKGETTTMKPGRQRRKPAAYKKWEKAAIAGVSLVADAAEHLERTATDKEVENDPGQKGSNPVSKVLPPFPTYSHNLFVENNILTSMKLKLQLFPFDDGTRRALEMDKHNPHLELTLSSRKKISSVLEHLNRKWGNSSVASGELLLFPYSVQGENLMDCPRWTQDSIVSAADVYAMLGRPPVFRLRYGWFSDTELGSAVLQQPSASCCILAENENIINNDNIKVTDSPPISVPSTIDRTLDLHEDQPALTNQNHALAPSSNYLPRELDKWTGMASSNKPVESSDLAANISWCRKEAGDGTIMRQFEDVEFLMILMLIALTHLLPKALNAFSRFHSVVTLLMLLLLLTYLSIRTRHINQRCHPMHLPSGMLKKRVMPSHIKRTLFFVSWIQFYPELLPQGPASRPLERAWRVLTVCLRSHLKWRNLWKALQKTPLMKLSLVHIF
ncbi:hypothetical protein I3843_10G121500 [Carya illinoinensis]|nr:hypothetical protein I3843_10G121500 [Carya illinoinensis]